VAKSNFISRSQNSIEPSTDLVLEPKAFESGGGVGGRRSTRLNSLALDSVQSNEGRPLVGKN